MEGSVMFPGVGRVEEGCGAVFLHTSSDGLFRVGENGVQAIAATGDRKMECIAFADRTLAYIGSGMGYPAY